MDWYVQVWKKYADFNGRARRKEYWMFALFQFLIIGISEIVGVALLRSGIGYVVLGLTVIYALAALVPSLSVAVRRLHDSGKSGWFLLIGLIPIVGGLIVLVFTVLDGTPGPNIYGPSPKFNEPVPAIG